MAQKDYYEELIADRKAQRRMGLYYTTEDAVGEVAEMLAIVCNKLQDISESLDYLGRLVN